MHRSYLLISRNTILIKCLTRNVQTRNTSVRVRFAPSPTGYLHLGGLRTALYNHLFALSNNGQTILRIEDTDQERKVEGAVAQLVQDLSWCGLHYDEGPVLQSERLPLYHRCVQMLIDSGHAYKCFCTSSRLDILRREAIKCGLVPKYDNRCRDLSVEETKAKVDGGTPFCVRFKLEPTSEPFVDIVYGEISHDVASLEGDPVILKTDSYPTYHLANVVDDHHMNITHVLRGVEWQGSTQKHLLLYRAFGWDPPKFGHLPLLLNPDGSKLSKRQGDVHVSQYRDKGVYPLALVNFVVRAGGGFDIQQWERDHKNFSLQQLAQKFHLSKINGSSCKVSLDKLAVQNQLEIQRLLTDEISTKELIKTTQQLVADHFNKSDSTHAIDISEQHVETILKWIQYRIHYLRDVLAPEWRFLWVLPITEPLTQEETQVLALLQANLTASSFQPDQLKSICQNCAKTSGIKFAQLMKLLRKTLSGLQEGPGVVEMMSVLGKDVVLQRLQRALQSSQAKESTGGPCG